MSHDASPPPPSRPVGAPPAFDPVPQAPLLAALAQLTEGVVIADAAGRIAFVNDAAAQLHGVARLDVRPEAYADTYHLRTEDGRPYPSTELPLARAVLHGETVLDARWRIRRPDGTEILALGSARPLRTPDGAQVGAVLTLRDATAHALAARERDALAERLRAAFEQNPASTVVYDATGRPVAANPAFERLWGAGMADVPPDYSVLTDPQLEAAGVLPLIRRAFAGEAVAIPPVRYDVASTAGRGRTLWAQAHLHPVRDAAGAVEQVVLTHEDVTARHEAEAALERQSALTRLVADNATAALFVMDRDGHPTYMNPAAVAMTGYTLDEIAGIPLHYAVHHRRPDGSPYPMAECPIDRALPEHFDVRAHEDVFLRKDGSFFPVVCAASPIIEGGVPVGTVVEVRDVTEERRAAAALREATAALETRNAELQDQALELEMANQQLQDQAAELEAQAEELQATAAQLEERTEEAEAARRAAEAERARAEGVLEGMADAHFALDAEFRIVAVNGAMERGSGLPRAALLGRSFWERFPGAVGTAFEWNYRRAATERVEAHFTHDYSDGRLDLVVAVDAYPAPGGGVAVFWRDVTERVRAEAALRASEAKYRTLFVSLDQGFCVIEVLFDAHDAPVDYRFLEANPVFAEQTGLAGAVGRTARELVPGLEAHWFELYGAVARTGESARFQQGSEAMGRWFDVFAFRVGPPDARQVAILFTDVSAPVHARREIERLLGESERARTEAEEARARAEEARTAADVANQIKSQFLATMSHELRTPLNAIGGHVQLLEMGLHGPVTAAQGEALSRVDRAQRHLLRLINDVLNFAKLESGRVEYDVQVVEIAEVIADVGLMVEPQLAAKGLVYEVRAPATECLVWADREKLTQVLLNLLSNAVKFTAAGGRVTVDVPSRAAPSGRPDLADVRVSDTGRGIPANKLEAIFEPFVQVGTDYSRPAEGTGLGLAISRDLARGMGGDLTAESREGVGSTLTVRLRRAVTADGQRTDRRSDEERRAEEARRSGLDRRHDDAPALDHLPPASPEQP